MSAVDPNHDTGITAPAATSLVAQSPTIFEYPGAG